MMPDTWGEEQFVRGMEKTFSAWKGWRLAVYGLGKNAERVLTKVRGLEFSVVVARDHIGTTFCRRPVVSLQDAFQQTDGMIIAATPKSTKEILDRIRPSIPKGYAVMSLHGHILSDMNNAKDPYWDKTLDDLKRAIDTHEMISFDIFDTLVMRKVLHPHDVFEMEERKLRERGEEEPFVELRVTSEVDQLAKGYFPNLDEIYQHLQEHHHVSEETARRWKAYEQQIERSVIVPRQDMVDVFQYAKKQGKTICLTSDMYLPKPEMERLLRDNGITGQDATLVSCDYQASKGNGGLFRSLLDMAHGRSVLHIGDNPFADGEVPQSLGIDTFLIRKASDLLGASSCAAALHAAESLDDRILLGTMLAHVFNSPFALHGTGGRMEWKHFEDMAWLCFLPMTMRYLQYIVQTVQHESDALLLFVSRDGYFLQQAYQTLSERIELPPSTYFYASRQAVYGAMIEKEADIDLMVDEFLEMGDQDLQYQLEYVFQIPFPEAAGMTIPTAVKRWGADGLRKWVKRKKDAIFSAQKKRRENYLRYLSTLHLEKYQKIYCVDLHTKGTVAYALQNLLHRPVDLIAVSAPERCRIFVPDVMRRHLMFGYDSAVFYSWFPIMEMIWASREGQLRGFSEEGMSVFAPHTEYDAGLLQSLQKSLQDGVSSYPVCDWVFRKFSKSFSCAMLDLLDYRVTDVSDDISASFSFYDPGNSMTDNMCNILELQRERNRGAYGV